MPVVAKGKTIARYRVTDDQGDQLRMLTRAVLPTDPNVVPDVAISLSRLCHAAAAELALDQVSVTLMGADSSYVLVARSEGPALGIEELQFDLGEGPGPEAYSDGRPVLVSDVRDHLGRWPGLVAAAADRQVHGVFAFPLQLGAVRFGVLTCLSVSPRPLQRHELNAAMIFADVATELLLDSSPTGDHPDPDLRAALQVHDVVYQAQGMAMVDLGVTLEVALARLRALAYAEGISLQVLAAEIVSGRRVVDRSTEP